MRGSPDGDLKLLNMSTIEKKRKAEAQPSQEPTPAKYQRSIKSDDTLDRPSSAAPKKGPPSLFAPQRTITIVITSSENPLSLQRFDVHEKLLYYYSSFFVQKSKRVESSLDANPEPITLQDVDPSTFGLFCNWIYYQKIRNEQGSVPGLLELARLWVLGEQFQVPALQNAAMNKIREEITYPADFEPFMLFAYSLESQGVELRRLAISRLAWTLPDPFRDILRRLPAEAQVDLIIELKSQRDAVPKDLWRGIGAARDFYVAEKDDEGEGE